MSPSPFGPAEQLFAIEVRPSDDAGEQMPDFRDRQGQQVQIPVFQVHTPR